MGSVTFASGADQDGSSVTTGAAADLGTAYTNAANQTPFTPHGTELASPTPLPPGIYNNASELGITGALTLDGGGNN